eukprot:CAMPEP_0197697132 /NCGR_PEP_ID=MMETSP1338-20131121/117549_1 /TAXON_ID=43686 ORGANISM="Pelagodinium beii, Strain RCC1491" /NCGR_SAMPLE_ID=MMETSP1338 /ASSEMBLY_ACC=CAM_ASM_000754 /LENGTH=114 /DNA_ID=CAMNT_0043280345 /DNA_START=44 /DNA_END=388 /DNA_ORIENTATION=+
MKDSQRRHPECIKQAVCQIDTGTVPVKQRCKHGDHKPLEVCHGNYPLHTEEFPNWLYAVQVVPVASFKVEHKHDGESAEKKCHRRQGNIYRLFVPFHAALASTQDMVTKRWDID